MTCCAPTIVPFGNETETVINYNAAMLENYGAKPNVQVFYKQGTEYALSDDMNQVRFDGVNITVDHGGSNTGFVKIF